LLAERGAKVLVNDKSKDKADEVVAAIKTKGGEAVAEYSDIASAGEAVVEAAVRHFDRLDIVVAAEGQFEDCKFEDATTAQHKAFMQTHLYGHVRVLMAAWPIMFQARFGRIVLLCSESGIHGRVGQVNYGAAKGTYIGLANSIAMEGFKYGIYSNVLCVDGDSSAVPGTFLCHDMCKASAGVFCSKSGHVQSLRLQSDEAFVRFDPCDGDAALESVATQWSDVARWDRPGYTGQERHMSYRVG